MDLASIIALVFAILVTLLIVFFVYRVYQHNNGDTADGGEFISGMAHGVVLIFMVLLAFYLYAAVFGWLSIRIISGT